MKSLRCIALPATLVLLLAGCVYTHTREPLTLNMDKTPVGSVEKTGSLTLITFPPLIGNYKLIAWGNAAVGEAARLQGMQEVYYADVEILSILKIWNEYTVHVYGK